MGNLQKTKDLFLWFMAVIYLFAFASLYVQIPGLYGDNGILPARLVIQEKAKSFEDFRTNQMTLLRLTPYLGLDVQTGMDCLCFLGIVISFLEMVFKSQRNCTNFALLWILYYSLFQVGQTFLWFQWDILLLEAGFLTIIVAPFTLFFRKMPHYQHDSITLWLIKWLLFRLMFASGVVKLTSQCPTWWGLTALNWHYESQCIPTPLAWYFHQLPEWWQKLSVVATYIIEIVLPFLFFAPVRSMRILAAFAQVFLMVMIVLTGNYNFFNLLTVALCVSCLDDTFLSRFTGEKTQEAATSEHQRPVLNILLRLTRWIIQLLVYGSIIWWSVKLFTLHFSGNTLQSKIAFTIDDLEKALQRTVPITIWIGAVSLGWEVLKAVYRSLSEEKGIIMKTWALLGCLVFGIIAGTMFAISLVPHTVVDEKSHGNPWPVIRQWHDRVHQYEVTHSYGLFRSMTGVGGRPEVVLEGTYSLDSKKVDWKEIEFLYKPGNVTRWLPFVAPHQPRLDWQMWFAALGTYNHNPWLLNLVYRILDGQPEVLELINYDPGVDRPYKFIRAQLYHYHYTSWYPEHERYSKTEWWVREKKKEYLPILSKDEPSLVNYLKQSGIIQDKKFKKPPATFLSKMLTFIRSKIGQMEGFRFCISLFTAAIVISFLEGGQKNSNTRS